MRTFRSSVRSALGCLWSATLLSSWGCVGNIGERDGSGGPKAGEGQAPICASGTAGPAPMRRLTRDEYNRTVHDLLGDDQNLADGFALDASIGLFRNNTNSPVTSLLATQYMEAADALATMAAGSLSTLLPCDPGAPGDEEACIHGFLDDFGKRAFRRPLTDAEGARYVALFGKMRTELGYAFADAVRVLLATILQSPSFLYHVEGVAGDQAAGTALVSGYELASRLSYFLWGTMPDEELLAAAESGALDTAEGTEKQVQRMIDHPYGRDGIRKLYDQWLNLEKVSALTKDPSVYPDFDAAVAVAMRAETEAFVDDVLWEQDGTLSTLLTASYSFLNETLAAIYDVPGVTGSDLQRTELDPSQRAGILSHASVLSVSAHAYQTSPVLRGKFVRERLLCQTLPSPPGNVNVNPPKPDPTLTTRERFAQHEKDPYCKSCHELMDPIGLGLEGYDPVGRFRTDENGLAIDDSGVIVKSEDVDGAFHGGVELAGMLAKSEQVAHCATTQFVTYALARAPSEEDMCSVDTLAKGKAPSELDLRALIVQITKTDAFRRRKVVPPEVCP